MWQVAYIVIARNAWRHYGDVIMLRTHYVGLKALMDYFTRHADKRSGLLETSCYGDWIDVSCDGAGHITPPGAVTAFYYVYALGLMVEISSVLGETADVEAYNKSHAQAVGYFHTRYFNAVTGGYAPTAAAPHGSQTSNAMALMLGAPPTPAIRARVADLLAADVIANGNHSTGGIVGQAWTYAALDGAGRGDLGLAALRQDTYPSFGRMVEQVCCKSVCVLQGFVCAIYWLFCSSIVLFSPFLVFAFLLRFCLFIPFVIIR